MRKKFLDYEIYMKPDTNTSSHFQWFYFKVTITKGKKLVNFTIKNFIKSTMLYSQGLRPFYKSNKNKQTDYQQIPNDVKFLENTE